MRPFRPGLLLFVLLVHSLSLSAQQTTSTSSPPATSDPQAVALLQRSLSALTGSVSISDVTLTGSAHRIAGSDDETGTATLTAMIGGNSKVSLSFPSGPRTEIRNSAGIPLADSVPPGVPAQASPVAQEVGAWSGPDGVLHGIANHNLTDATWFFPVFTVANLVSSGNYALSYIGQETLDGQPVWHVSAVQPSSDPRPGIAELTQHLTQIDIFIDPTTYRPVALSFNAHPDDNATVDIAVGILFSDYQSLNGVEVPLHLQKYLNGGLVLDVQLSNAILNSGLAASTFAIQ